jgi:hypothetical protein
MKIRIEKNLKEFKSLMKIISAVGMEPILVFNPDELKIYAHTTGIIATYGTFKKDYFEEYNVSEKQIFKVKNTDIMTGIIKANNSLEMEHIDPEIIQRVDKFKFTLPIYENTDFNDGEPKVEYDNKVNIKIEDLKTGLNAVKGLIDMEIDFIIKDNNLKLFGEKQQRKVEYDIGEVIHPDTKVSMQYNQVLILAQDGDFNVDFYLEKNKPILFHYKNETIDFKTYFAPLVDNEE